VNDFSPVDHYKRHCKCLHTVGGRCLIFRRTLLRYMRIMAPVVCLSFVVCRLSSVQRSAREAAAPSQITGPIGLSDNCVIRLARAVEIVEFLYVSTGI